MRFPRPRSQIRTVLIAVAALAALLALFLQLDRVRDDGRRAQLEGLIAQNQGIIDQAQQKIVTTQEEIQGHDPLFDERSADVERQAKIREIKRKLAKLKQADDDRGPAADEELPTDEAGEKRRDYAVLDAALDDLADLHDPEFASRIQNARLVKEVVINSRMEPADLVIQHYVGLDRKTDKSSGEDVHKIPADVYEDFKRRSKVPASSLADFKPANPNVVVDDLDGMLDKPKGILGDSLARYARNTRMRGDSCGLADLVIRRMASRP